MTIIRKIYNSRAPYSLPPTSKASQSCFPRIDPLSIGLLPEHSSFILNTLSPCSDIPHLFTSSHSHLSTSPHSHACLPSHRLSSAPPDFYPVLALLCSSPAADPPTPVIPARCRTGQYFIMSSPATVTQERIPVLRQAIDDVVSSEPIAPFYRLGLSCKRACLTLGRSSNISATLNWNAGGS